MNGINGQKPHPIKNGIRIQCNTENFVPIVVPGLSTSSSSSFPSSTSMTGKKHPTSSSSSSTSPPMTSSKETDYSDRPPAIVSSESVDRQERRDLYSCEASVELLNKPTKFQNQIKMRITPVPFRHTGMAARIQRESCGWQSSWTQRLTRKFFWWSIFRAHIQETWGFGQAQCLYSFP